MAKRITALIVLLALLIAAGYVCVRYYSYIFAKTVHGKIIRVERVSPPGALITGREAPAAQMFSFAVAIQDKTDEIHTASSEDRQWAVAQSGQCVEAKFFPYAPWDLELSGTYHGARLIRLYACPK